MSAPTEKQLLLLRTVADYSKANGYPPTIRELCARLKQRSTNGVAEQLAALERKGLVLRTKVSARTTVITADGYRWLESEGVAHV